MKVVVLVLILLCLGFNYSKAEDTAVNKRLNNLEQTVSTIQTSLNQINQKLTIIPPAAAQVTTTTSTPPTSIQNKPRQLSRPQKWYVVMPVILFLFIFIVLIIWLNRGGYSLADALQGDVPIKVEQPNTAIADATKAATTAALPAAAVAAAAGVAAVPVQINLPSNMPSTVTVSQTDENDNPVLPKSSSRFIALFSGFTGVIIAICLVSYYVYFSIANVPAPDFSAMLEAVLGLGIGVVPYAVTKFTQK